MKRVFVILANGFEETEALTPTDLLRRAGVEVTLVSLNDTAAVTGSHNIRITGDAVFSECRFDEADLIMLPGGKAGTENLERHQPLHKLQRDAAARGAPTRRSTSAGRVLGQLGLLQGKAACCYPGNEDLLRGADVTFDPVTVADGCITSRGMGTAFEFGLALIRHLCGEDAAANVARQTVYQVN